jgi:hypothetical protein
MPEQHRGTPRPESARTATPPGEHARTQPPHDGNGGRTHGRRAYDVDPRRGSVAVSDQDHVRLRRAGNGDDRPAHAGVGPGSAVGRSSSWGPVLSGAATAFVVFLIFTTLWLAMAASGVDAVGDNLAWFQLISGILAAGAGGAAAGWLDPRGTMTGMIQGLATWGLLVLAVVVTGITTGTALLGEVAAVDLQADVQVANTTALLEPVRTEMWALFAILMGGALIAGLAGAMTGRAHTMLALDDDTHADAGRRESAGSFDRRTNSGAR